MTNLGNVAGVVVGPNPPLEADGVTEKRYVLWGQPITGGAPNEYIVKYWNTAKGEWVGLDAVREIIDDSMVSGDITTDKTFSKVKILDLIGSGGVEIGLQEVLNVDGKAEDVTITLKSSSQPAEIHLSNEEILSEDGDSSTKLSASGIVVDNANERLDYQSNSMTFTDKVSGFITKIWMLRTAAGFVEFKFNPLKPAGVWTVATADELDLKLNIADYNQHFRGKYTSLALLQAAISTANDGDYAIIDTGTGVNAKEYIWDAQEGWIQSSSTSASTTDALPEGSTNLYFTAARALAAAAASIALKQDILTDINFGAFINGLTGKTTPINADSISIVDSADSNKQKKVSLTNIKAFLKVYFDGIYQAILVSGTSIKTVGGVSLLGAGDIPLYSQKTITGNVTLDDSYNGCIVKVKATSTISIPATLATNFNCVFDVWSGFTATFTPLSGASIIETALVLDSDKMATLYKDGATSVYKLKGQTT